MCNATLYLLCGKAASGKSTLAAKLASEHGGILLAEDDYLTALYGDGLVTLKDYVRYSAKLKEAIRPLIVQLLSHGVSVVLDFPANTTWQRDWLRALVEESGCPHELHYLDVSNEVCMARLTERNRQGTHSFTLTEEQFNALSEHFAPPSVEEGFNLTIHQT